LGTNSGSYKSDCSQREKAFGMEVCAWSENLNLSHANELGVLPMSKEDLLKNSDIILIIGQSNSANNLLSSVDQSIKDINFNYLNNKLF